MLQSILLVDEGENDLDYKHQELKKIIAQEQTNFLSEKIMDPPLTTEE